MMMGNEAQIAVIERAFRAFLPAFVLMREREAVVSTGAGNHSDAGPALECLIAHGMAGEEAKAFTVARLSHDVCVDDFFHIHHAGYHLVGVQPAATCTEGPRAGSFLGTVQAQLELAAGLLRQESCLQRCLAERKLIADALDSLPLSIFVLDRDRRYVFQNANDRDTFLDLRDTRIEQTDIDPLMAAQWARQHDEVLKEGKTFDRKDKKRSRGEVFTSRTMMAPVRDATGICGIVGFALDCTAEASAVRLLEQNEARLQAWLRLSSDWVWETDDEHRFTLVEGDNVAQRLDFSAWIGRRRWEIVGVDPANDALWGEYKQLVDARRPIRSFRFEMARNDGAQLVAEVNADPVFDPAGAFIGYRGVTRDVTEREALLSRLRRAEMIANETQHAIVIADARGRITWVNPAFLSMTGYALDEVAGYTPGSILQCPETNPDTVAEIRAALRKGEGIRTTILNRTKDGRHYWLDLEIRPIYCRGGKLDGFIAIENDITDLIDDKTRKDAIFENATAGIVIHDETGATIDCNFEAARILGVTTDQLLGRTAMDPAWHLINGEGKPLPDHEVPAIRALRENELWLKMGDEA